MMEDRCNCGHRNRYSHFSTNEDGGREEVMSCNKYRVCPTYDDILNQNQIFKNVLHGYINAMEITRQYVGKQMLPPIKGWSWYDADVAARELLHLLPVDEEDK